jgi:hypothetical protein
MVNDCVTGLVWQQTVPLSACQSSALCSSEAAKSYCDGLVLGGSRGWRLPTEEELFSIYETSEVPPMLDSSTFPDTPTDYGFWTSTTVITADGLPGTWIGTFGAMFTVSVQDTYHVRCVW